MTRILIRMGFALDLSGATTGLGVGEAASFTFTASGGQVPYKITMEEENLPSEWTWVDNGDGTFTVLTFAAVEARTYTFTLQVKDALRKKVQRTYDVFIQPLDLTLSGTPDPASEGVAYGFALTRSGGTGAISITDQSGFPDGLSAVVVGDTVEIEGTPDAGTAAGSPWAASVTIQDEAEAVAIWDGEIEVSAGDGFPVLNSLEGESDGSLNTSHLVPIPAAQAGDLLMVLLCTSDQSAVTTPTGWIALDSALLNAAEDGAGRLGCYYREVDGSETSPVDFGTGVACGFASLTYWYAGGTFIGTPEIEAIGGTSDSPDPPSLSPTWGLQKNAWIAAQCNVSGEVPTAFPLPDSVVVNSGFVRILAVCREDDETGTKDPGTFTLDTSVDWRAYTIAIQGSG